MANNNQVDFLADLARLECEDFLANHTTPFYSEYSFYAKAKYLTRKNENAYISVHSVP